MICSRIASLWFLFLSFLVNVPSFSYDARGDIVNIANAQLGKPYTSGFEGPNRFDCSGLTQYVYRHVGKELYRVVKDQITQGQQVVSRKGSYYDAETGKMIPYENAEGQITDFGITKILSQLQMGDLVFFGNSNDDAYNQKAGHVGIYITDKNIINAYYDNPAPNTPNDGRVRYDNISTYVDPTWWRHLFIQARRHSDLPGPSIKFSIDDVIEVTDSGMCVRDAENEWRCPKTIPAAGVQGNILSLPMIYSGLWFWHVELESGMDGWVAEQYLAKVGPFEWLSFLQGNPGKPGDGRVVSKSGDLSWPLTTPIELGDSDAEDGLTLGVFPPRGSTLPTSFVVQVEVAGCGRTFGSQLPIIGKTIRNGVTGMYAHVYPAYYQQWIEFMKPSCPMASVQDLRIYALWPQINGIGILETLDAAYVGWGLNM